MTDTPSSNRPPLKAFVTREYQVGKEIRTSYLEIGVAWPHKNGEGVNLKIHEGISVTGTIVILKPRENAAAKAEEAGEDGARRTWQDEQDIPFN